MLCDKNDDVRRIGTKRLTKQDQYEQHTTQVLKLNKVCKFLQPTLNMQARSYNELTHLNDSTTTKLSITMDLSQWFSNFSMLRHTKKLKKFVAH